MKPLIFTHEAPVALSECIAKRIDAEVAQVDYRTFPDGESYVRVKEDCSGRDAVIVANLHEPNAKILPLIFLCETLRALGINSILLVCPYLPYMRQDIQFNAGEGITSRFFAKLMSQYLDALVTIDPHLHRYNNLDEIYSLKSKVLHANPFVANWVKSNIQSPLIVGPDSESEQWAASAADIIGCPYIILEKTRMGDKKVLIAPPEASHHNHLTPVLIDDIISTGRTMIQTANALKQEGFEAPVCIGVHALFSDDAYAEMKAAYISKIVTCNTVPHETNEIDLTTLVSEQISGLLNNKC